jgi:hypothetical protein
LETPLYVRVLGDAFAKLPRVLQRFHSAGPARARGVLKVTRGSGLLHRIVGWLGRLPPASDAVELGLEVKVEGGKERWIRHFDGMRVESLQWQEGELLAEAAGPATFLFRLEGTSEGVGFRFVRARVLGIPLPKLLAPSVAAEARKHEDPGAWEVDVQFTAPMLGPILRYEGVVRFD